MIACADSDTTAHTDENKDTSAATKSVLHMPLDTQNEHVDTAIHSHSSDAYPADRNSLAVDSDEEPKQLSQDMLPSRDIRQIPPAYHIPREHVFHEDFFAINDTTTLYIYSYVVVLTRIKRSISGERFFSLHVKNTKKTQEEELHFSSFDRIQTLYLADLNANTYPEIYIVWSSDGSGAFGVIEGFEFSHDVFTKIDFPEFPQSTGYRGYDKFVMYPDYIEHSYPLYAENDANTVNSLGTAYLRYSFDYNSLQVNVERME